MIEVFQKAIFQKEISSGEREPQENGQFDLVALFDALGEMCAWAKQPIVLLIDEIDSASNNQVFPDFLAQLEWPIWNGRRFRRFIPLSWRGYTISEI